MATTWDEVSAVGTMIASAVALATLALALHAMRKKAMAGTVAEIKRYVTAELNLQDERIKRSMEHFAAECENGTKGVAKDLASTNVELERLRVFNRELERNVDVNFVRTSALSYVNEALNRLSSQLAAIEDHLRGRS